MYISIYHKHYKLFSRNNCCKWHNLKQQLNYGMDY